MKEIEKHEIFGFLRPEEDVHTLGINQVSDLLKTCGIKSIIADAQIAEAISHPELPGNPEKLNQWIRINHITRIGFSYRLDPFEGRDAFGRFIKILKTQNLLEEQGGPIRSLFFAGLPETCVLVKKSMDYPVVIFQGDETPSETLRKLGVSSRNIPQQLVFSSEYDDWRMDFGKDIIQKEKYKYTKPFDRSGSPGFGSKNDRLEKRLDFSLKRAELPLLRVHAGPYDPDRKKAIGLFKEWARHLSHGGFLDILSIGTSQLSQSKFAEEWTGLHNGGGVPINSANEYIEIWQAARPMLVRTYAGTKNIPYLAQVYEETINMAWHALSFWWFSRIDGRGPNSVFKNLNEHFSTLDFIAKTRKPFEPNVPHHFAFRGADDVTYVLSAFLAAKVAKMKGVRTLILQVMLNTPKNTWGIQDLAKARAALQLLRVLEDSNFRVILQPRAGLDYFSTDEMKAKSQLAAVTALMDDIEPGKTSSPEIIHVVSYSEATKLADPFIMNESMQICLSTLKEYRSMRRKGDTPAMQDNQEVREREEHLISEAKAVLAVIEKNIGNPYSPEGFYKIFAAGFLPVPYLWEEKEEFSNAISWKTQLINGGVHVVDENQKPIPASIRASLAAEKLKTIHTPILRI